MYRKQVRRRRAVLILLVIVSLVLLSANFSESQSGPLHSIQRTVSSALAPIEEGADRALKPARDAINWVDETFDARGENEQLRADLAETRNELAAAQTEAGDYDEVAKLADIPHGGVEGYDAVTARVIGRSPTVWYSTVTLDHGSSSGLRIDDPVRTGDGLVGHISDVTSGTSQVTLITDHTSAVSARVIPDGPLGVVKPEVGDPEDLLLDFIEEDRVIDEGATLVTAGSISSDLESLFPYGIPIGEVTQLEAAEQETYQRVHVKPFADLQDFDYAQVLIPVERGSGGKG
jgi:rod shape-determining protein MreC